MIKTKYAGLPITFSIDRNAPQDFKEDGFIYKTTINGSPVNWHTSISQCYQQLKEDVFSWISVQ